MKRLAPPAKSMLQNMPHGNQYNINFLEYITKIRSKYTKSILAFEGIKEEYYARAKKVRVDQLLTRLLNLMKNRETPPTRDDGFLYWTWNSVKRDRLLDTPPYHRLRANAVLSKDYETYLGMKNIK